MSLSGEEQMVQRKRIIVGVAGGIAAYKAATVVRQLTEAGHSVRVVPTESALRFVGAATFEALSGNPVHTGVFEDVHEVPHVRFGQTADLVVVAPATADLLARAAIGRADDLLTATLLTARCPVLYAPAMHTEMWLHPATSRECGNVTSPRFGRDGARIRPLDRGRYRPRTPAGSRRDLHAGAAAPRRAPTRCPTTSQASRFW